MHKTSFENLTSSSNGQYLITTGDRILKFWNANMQLDINHQVGFFNGIFFRRMFFDLEFSWTFETHSKDLIHG